MNPPEPKFVKFVAEFSDLGRVSGVGVSFMDAANGNLVLRQAVPVKVGAPPEDVAAQLEVLAAWVRTRVRSRYKELVGDVKPQLLQKLDEALYQAKLKGKPFDRFLAGKDEIEEAKQWCRRLMSHHFTGDLGTFMWNGVEISERDGQEKDRR